MKQSCDAHGGRVRGALHAEEGTTFTVHLASRGVEKRWPPLVLSSQPRCVLLASSGPSSRPMAKSPASRSLETTSISDTWFSPPASRFGSTVKSTACGSFAPPWGSGRLGSDWTTASSLPTTAACP